MSWTYKQSAGEMISPLGITFFGYSGRGDGKNNHEYQEVHNIGPIPVGTYTIGPAYHDSEKGPCVMHLAPDASNEMFGRAGFLIHGDNPKHNYSASEGCIILGPVARPTIDSSNDKILTVIE